MIKCLLIEWEGLTGKYLARGQVRAGEPSTQSMSTERKRG